MIDTRTAIRNGSTQQKHLHEFQRPPQLNIDVPLQCPEGLRTIERQTQTSFAKHVKKLVLGKRLLAEDFAQTHLVKSVAGD